MIERRDDRFEGQLYFADDPQRDLFRDDRWQNCSHHMPHDDRRRFRDAGSHAQSRCSLAAVCGRCNSVGGINVRGPAQQSLLAPLDHGSPKRGGRRPHRGVPIQAYRPEHLSRSYGHLVASDFSGDADRHFSRSKGGAA